MVGWEGKRESVPRRLLRSLGEDMDGFMACHHCDNRACCNPWHLYRGTRLDNGRDASVRGRMQSPAKSFPGERNPGAKLCEAQVRAIRARRGSISAPKLGAEVGLGAKAVRDIWHRRSWSHLPEV